MKEEQVILVNQKDEPLGLCPKMEAHRKALLHRAFSVFIFNDEGKLLLQQRASGKYHSPDLWTNTVCSHQRDGESNIEAATRRLQEEMGMQTDLKEVFHFIYKAELPNGLTEHELDHVLIGFSNDAPRLNPDEVRNYRWESLENIEKDIQANPEKYTEWFKIIFANSLPELQKELDRYFLQKPIKFNPVFKEKPWGGKKLQSLLNKDIPSEHTGESWEISAVPDNISTVSDGYFKGMSLPDLVKKFRENFTGKKVYRQFQNDFPLLIKYIDAADDLSIQVHPDDQTAKAKHNSFGKNELWHIVQADAGAVLYIGFQPHTGKQEYLHHLQNGTLEKLLRRIPVKAGDTFYIPAGTVHAIGKGILLAEVQQTSDITYRIYDWNRQGLDGKPRPLHTEAALEAIDFDARPQARHEAKIETPYFNIEKLEIDKIYERNIQNLDSFVILMNISGHFDINGEEVLQGETVLLPAQVARLQIKPKAKGKILIIYL